MDTLNIFTNFNDNKGILIKSMGSLVNHYKKLIYFLHPGSEDKEPCAVGKYLGSAGATASPQCVLCTAG